MAGWIGSVGQSAMLACTRRDRAISPVTTDLEIFYNLDARRVFLDRLSGQLYFVDSPQSVVKSTIQSVLTGMRRSPTVEQLHLDPHGCFNAACRLRLAEDELAAVLVALRLAGVRAAFR